MMSKWGTSEIFESLNSLGTNKIFQSKCSCGCKRYAIIPN
jgi:hypothetical protein